MPTMVDAQSPSGSLIGYWIKGTSILVLGMALAVMAGWYLQSPMLVQLNPHWASMKFNNALCLALEAGWLLMVFREGPVWTRMRVGATLVILGVSILTGLEYLADVSFGIDELFVRDFIPVQTSTLGRMSPITTVCHLMLGGFLAVNTFQWAKALRRIGNFLPPLSLALSCIAIMGYTLHIEAGYGWGNLTKMAFHTAVAIFLLSLSAITQSLSNSKGGGRVSESWRLAPLILAGWFLVGMLGVTMGTHAQATLASQTQRDGELLKRISELEVQSTKAALDRFADRETRRERYGLTVDSLDMRHYFSGIPQLLSIRFPDGSVSGNPDRSKPSADGALYNYNSAGFEFALDLARFIPLAGKSGKENGLLSFPPDGENMQPGKGKYSFRLEGSQVVLDFSESVRSQEDIDNRLYFIVALAALVLAVFSAIALRTAGLADARANALTSANGNLESNARELERSNTDLEQFVFVASHDLQTPLRHVGGFTKLLMERPDFPADPAAREYGKFILEGVERMQNLITGLLELSRVEKTPPVPQRIELRDLIMKAIRNLGPELTQCGGTVELPESLPAVSGNLLRLSQLFENLLQNSIKYRSAERPLRVTVSAGYAPDLLWLRLEDSGMGIKPEYREKVFQLFQRLHNQGAIKGTGIGLTLCRRIMEQHGGRMHLEDSRLGGIAVVLEFPLRLPRDSAASPGPTPMEAHAA